jgi:hypothetical protein
MCRALLAIPGPVCRSSRGPRRRQTEGGADAGYGAARGLVLQGKYRPPAVLRPEGVGHSTRTAPCRSPGWPGADPARPRASPTATRGCATFPSRTPGKLRCSIVTRSESRPRSRSPPSWCLSVHPDGRHGPSVHPDSTAVSARRPICPLHGPRLSICPLLRLPAVLHAAPTIPRTVRPLPLPATGCQPVAHLPAPICPPCLPVSASLSVHRPRAVCFAAPSVRHGRPVRLPPHLSAAPPVRRPTCPPPRLSAVPPIRRPTCPPPRLSACPRRLDRIGRPGSRRYLHGRRGHAACFFVHGNPGPYSHYLPAVRQAPAGATISAVLPRTVLTADKFPPRHPESGSRADGMDSVVL